jgi:hypothetical protein
LAEVTPAASAKISEETVASPVSAMLTRARRYNGRRATVASGIARLGGSERPFPLTSVA